MCCGSTPSCRRSRVIAPDDDRADRVARTFIGSDSGRTGFVRNAGRGIGGTHLLPRFERGLRPPADLANRRVQPHLAIQLSPLARVA